MTIGSSSSYWCLLVVAILLLTSNTRATANHERRRSVTAGVVNNNGSPTSLSPAVAPTFAPRGQGGGIPACKSLQVTDTSTCSNECVQSGLLSDPVVFENNHELQEDIPVFGTACLCDGTLVCFDVTENGNTNNAPANAPSGGNSRMSVAVVLFGGLAASGILGMVLL